MFALLGDVADINLFKDAAYAIGTMASNSDVVGISTAATIIHGLATIATGKAKEQYVAIDRKWQEMSGLLKTLNEDLTKLGYCLDMTNLDIDVKALAVFLDHHSNQKLFSRTTLRTLLDADFMINAVTQYAAAITFSYTNVLTQAVMIMYAELRKDAAGGPVGPRTAKFGGASAPVRSPGLKAFLHERQKTCLTRQSLEEQPEWLAAAVGRSRSKSIRSAGRRAAAAAAAASGAARKSSARSSAIALQARADSAVQARADSARQARASARQALAAAQSAVAGRSTAVGRTGLMSAAAPFQTPEGWESFRDRAGTDPRNI